MPESSQQITPRIIVTTDFSLESERAFYHALAIAVARQARLTVLHTGSESRDAVPWHKFPGVRETLAGWGLLPVDAPRSAVAEMLNVVVAKMSIRDDDPRQGITDYLRKHPTDLLVMATEGRTGLARMLNPSVADTVSYLTNSHTLMLPRHGRNFVDPSTGRTQLRRVLCSLDSDHDPRPAVAYLRQWLPAFSGDADMQILWLQTTDTGAGQDILLPQAPGQTWRQERRSGEPTKTIIETAREFGADLLVLNVRSPLSPMARMRGNRNDRVLRELNIPLLSVPIL